NKQYFNGQLSPEVMEILESLQFQHPEQAAFAERIIRFMYQSAFPARDFSSFLAWAISFLPSRMLPSAWGGVIPSLTMAGRHRLIDDFLRTNSYSSIRDGGTLLDIGCGFPPITAVELAAAFPRNEIVGAD